ncbi:MAG: PAS domain S-box protein [Candidatus Bathyarchaeia archaeon]
MSKEVVDEESQAPILIEGKGKRESSEEGSREAEQRYKELFNSVSDGLFQTDLKGNFTIVNPAFASIMGYEPKDLLYNGSKTWRACLSNEEIAAISMEITERGELRDKLIRFTRPDGSLSWIEVSLSVRRDENGSPVGYEGVVREVTDRVMYEGRLEALHTHASDLGNATSVDDVTELTFDTIEKILGFNLGSFSVVEGDFLCEIHTRGVKTYNLFKMPLDGPGITVRAVRTRETQLVPDVREDGDYVRGPAEGSYEALSELDVPVKVDGDVIAVINVESTKLDAFTDEDRKLLEILAGHVASTIQKIRLLESERLYKAKIEALHRHASELNTANTMEDIAATTMNAVECVLGFPLGAFCIVKDGTIVPIHIKGIDIELHRELPLDGPGIVVRAVKTGVSQLVPDTRIDKDYLAAYVEEGKHTLSELAVPVIMGSEAKAVINLESGELNLFTEEDMKLVEIFAKHVASAFSRLQEMEMLRKSEEKFKTLLEESMDAVSVLVGTKIVYANKKMAELVGFKDPSEYIGRYCLDYVADEDKEIVGTRALGRQRGEKHVQRYEFKMLRTDGTIIDVETYVSLIEYEGKPASLTFNRNVTERKKMEWELRDYAELLEEMVEERTRELKEAERLAAIGELAAMVGHDLRNPLTGMAGAAYFLKKKYGKKSDETTKRMLEVIEKDIQYANNIINDLLDYSRTLKLNLSTMNPMQLVSEALDSIDVPENIRVRDLTLDEPEIEVDAQMMKRVVINLVKNAIDAMPSGGSLTIESKKTEEGAELYFTDTGVGISKKNLEKIWRPLFTTKAKGMGLGLSICKRVLENHGASIAVKSKQGEGTTFIVKLPLRQ